MKMSWLSKETETALQRELCCTVFQNYHTYSSENIKNLDIHTGRFLFLLTYHLLKDSGVMVDTTHTSVLQLFQPEKNNVIINSEQKFTLKQASSRVACDRMRTPPHTPKLIEACGHRMPTF